MAEINLLTQLYNDFISILQYTVIKYNIYSEKNETVEMKRNADAFITASLLKDKFNTYIRYDKSIISEIMKLNPNTDYEKIEEYHMDNSKIPYNLRDKFLLMQREKIINEYVERNNYYRMLNGLPDIEETEEDYIYIDINFANKYGIDREIPIHLLDEEKISILQDLKYIDSLIDKYPDKKYLRFLGKEKIDIVSARTAKNFSLLKIPYSISSAIRDKFSFIYEQCRVYFMSCIYIPEYRNTIDYYDNFIALCIMVMTIQQIVARVIKDTIERNFFDDYCIRTLFNVYGVPYYNYMDAGTRQQIVQDLNILVLNKGTNKVLYDIATILGYDRLKIYKYYLVKNQKFDSHGIPTVSYKEDSETGEQVLDYTKMFDIYFKKVELEDLDVHKSLLDPSGKVDYQEITQNDPFWVEDDALLKEIYESEYNFVETKYLGIGISYKLSKILFENIYLIKMLFEKKNEIAGITVNLPKISFFSEVSLFDAIVTLCAMVCKQNNLKGEILTKPSAILHVLGFNFERDFEIIRNEIMKNSYLDNSLTNFLTTSNAYTVESINKLYQNMVDLYDAIVEAMSTTQSIEVYDAYRKLYETLYYTDENQTMFNIGFDETGKIKYAKSFLEYLEYENKELYDLIANTEPDNFSEYINHICQKIMQIIPNLKYFGILSGRSETMEEMLIGLIRFFKSYTTDMLGLDIIYIFDMKPELLLRLIDEITINKTIQPEDEFMLSHSDHLEFTSTVRYKSKLKLLDKIACIIGYYQLFDSLKFNDVINKIYKELLLHENNNSYMYDIIDSIATKLYSDTELFIRDSLRYHSELMCQELLSFENYIKMIVVNCIYNLQFGLFDITHIISIQNQLHDSKFLNEAYKIYTYYDFNDKILFEDFLLFIINFSITEEMNMMDILSIIENISLCDFNKMMFDRIMWKCKDYIDSAVRFFGEVNELSKQINIIGKFSSFFDFMNSIVNTHTKDYISFSDSCKISYSD